MNASDFYPRVIPMIERFNQRAAARLMGKRDAGWSHVTLDVAAISVLAASDYPKSGSSRVEISQFSYLMKSTMLSR